MKARVLRFIPRQIQLRLRKAQRLSRFITRDGNYVRPSAMQREELRREARTQEHQDAHWRRRHGPVSGGASVSPFRCEMRKGLTANGPKGSKELSQRHPERGGESC